MPVSPDRPKGPPLNALRAFEAAARLGGFLAAAEELGVTPGAVSQHIKTLEAWAGTPLFERRAQGVRLTAHGAEVAQTFTEAFDHMGAAVRALRGGAARPAIAIAALPGVAQLWLAPRMPAIRTALPDVEISVTALEQRPNLRREMFDLSLFLDRSTGTAQETVLMCDRLLPVCSPDIAAELRTPGDLLRHRWLVDTAWQGDWRDWLQARAPGLIRPLGPAYSLYALALAEAEAGAGVLIGHQVLVGDRIASGRLAAPFEAADAGVSLNMELATPPRPGSALAGLAEMLKTQAQVPVRS
jgi:LysR family glycine cleavage system transcriptional activator